VNVEEGAASTGVAYITARRQYPAGTLPVPTYRVVTEVGSALNGHREEFLALLRDPAVSTIVVKHRDRVARFGAEYVEAALTAHGRRLLVVDPARRVVEAAAEDLT
jgi:predicted site-specific integrase-resolvase